MPYKDKDKQREYQREWMAKRREEYFAGKKCLQCGGVDNFELHHRDPDTKVSHRVCSWAKDRREKELKKCGILCYECHIKKTIEQFSVEWEHGTPYGYRTHRCRCNDCREAHKLYFREYNASKL